jgi:hypothetical protein
MKLNAIRTVRTILQEQPLNKTARQHLTAAAVNTHACACTQRTLSHSLRTLLGAPLHTTHANEAERGTRKGFVFKKIVKKENRISGLSWGKFFSILYLFLFMHIAS